MTLVLAELTVHQAGFEPCLVYLCPHVSREVALPLGTDRSALDSHLQVRREHRSIREPGIAAGRVRSWSRLTCEGRVGLVLRAPDVCHPPRESNPIDLG